MSIRLYKIWIVFLIIFGSRIIELDDMNFVMVFDISC